MTLKIGELEVDIGADTSGLKKADREIKSTAKKAEQSFKSVGVAIQAAISAEVVRRVVIMADNISVMTRRLERFAGSAESAQKTMASLAATSNAVGASISDTVSIFERFSIIRQELGATNDEILQVTDTLAKLGAIGGSSAGEISNSLRQLSQGLAGGVLRAEEFNSVIENTPAIAQAIGKQMGLSMGELRQAMLDGQLTSEIVFAAIQAAASDTAKEFEKVPLSLGVAFQALTNNFAVVVDEINKGVAGTQTLAETVKGFADTILTIPNDLRVAFTGIFSQIDQFFARATAFVKRLGVNIKTELTPTFGNASEVRERQKAAIDAINAERDARIAASKAAVDATIEQEVRLVQEKKNLARGSGVAETPEAQQEKNDSLIEMLEKFHAQRQSVIDSANSKEIESNQNKIDTKKKQESDYTQSQIDLVNQTANSIANIISATGNSSAANIANIINQVAGMATTISTIMSAQAQAQAAADPTAITLPQKIANIALITSQFVGIFASIKNARGGGRQFGGTTSGMLAHPINEAGVPEVLNQGGRQYLLPTGQGGKISPLEQSSGSGSANVTIISNGTPQTVTGTSVSKGEITVMINDAMRSTENKINSSLASGRGDTYNALKKSSKLERNLNG